MFYMVTMAHSQHGGNGGVLAHAKWKIHVRHMCGAADTHWKHMCLMTVHMI